MECNPFPGLLRTREGSAGIIWNPVRKGVSSPTYHLFVSGWSCGYLCYDFFMLQSRVPFCCLCCSTHTAPGAPSGWLPCPLCLLDASEPLSPKEVLGSWCVSPAPALGSAASSRGVPLPFTGGRCEKPRPGTGCATGASLSLVSAGRAGKSTCVPSAADTNTPVTIPASVHITLT